ncbi:MAG: hypothetical protein K0S33_460 [Bacteroidetes bacterium]|jgi:hypothetical protein|nr:hypothetical protein [Bacteroidota bacterium]
MFPQNQLYTPVLKSLPALNKFLSRSLCPYGLYKKVRSHFTASGFVLNILVVRPGLLKRR